MPPPFSTSEQPSRRPGLRLWGGILLLLSGLLWADKWYIDYQKALSALKGGNWTGALSHLDAALAKRDRPKYQARTVGMEFIDYFPHYYRGLAHYRLGQLQAAQEALERSRSFGESTRIPALAEELETMLRDCRQRLERSQNKDEPPVQARDDLAETPQNAAAEKKAERLKEPGPVATQPEERHVQPEIRKSGPDPRPPKEEARRTEIAQPPVDALTQTKTTLLTEGRRLLAARDLDKAELKFTALLQLDGQDVGALRGLAASLRARRVMHINQGIRHYFAGDATRARILLEESVASDETDPRDAARAHRFLAVIAAEAILVDGDPGGTLRERARHHLRLGVGDASMTLSPRHFSPRLLRLLEEIRQEN
jgi:tetratricopeptide (TPR) repeat protein